MAFIAPTAGRVDIDIAIALVRFLVVHRRVTIMLPPAVKLPLRSGRPSPLCRALHQSQFVIMPSIAAHCCCALGPLPPRLHHPSSSRTHRAVHCRRHQEQSHCPSTLRSHCTVHCLQGAVAPYLTIKEPSAVSSANSGHSSPPSQASCPDGCHVASPHAATFHLPAPLIAASPIVPLVHPAGRRVSLLLTSTSHGAIHSCRTPLGLLPQLVKVLPLLTPLPHICSIIKTSKPSGLILIYWSNIMLTWMNHRKSSST